ncbi:phospho-sugar mutase [Clostridiaceae bacterium M8S5]|nr:phospho-sugar mutase [Clostridiaceae bacterium M8S5]
MYKERYNKWLNNKCLDEDIRKELESIRDDDEEIKDRFYKNLEFGTAGLRGIIGAGTNRMNKYMISLATEALAHTIIKIGGEKAKARGVVIGYDTRHYSDVFAKTAALIMANNGIKVYLYKDIRPTPMVSYAIRKLNCYSGIMITASHNPREYNGYKAYWKEGSQILGDIAQEISSEMEKIQDVTSIASLNENKALESGLLNILGKQMDKDYTNDVLKLHLRDNVDKSISIVYTPLNGTGNIPVRRVLDIRGFKNVYVVEEQELPDPNFTTVSYPNPENREVFDLAVKLGEHKHADLIIATDPDCDRMTCMVRDNGSYQYLNGNQVGALLINYILEARNEQHSIPSNGVIVKTIVTGDLGKKIADSYGVKTIETLTGFKYICQGKNGYEEDSKYKFIFGYEESIGYVYSTIVRDKDAVISSMLLCEACAYYKMLGKSLCDVLNKLYKVYGYHNEKLLTIKLNPVDGAEKIKKIMNNISPQKSNLLPNVVEYIDYNESTKYNLQTGDKEILDLPRTNAKKYVFDDSSWFAVRPSGTEPKLKIYINCISNESKDAQFKVSKIEHYMKDVISSV